jgi:hypothetical protein
MMSRDNRDDYVYICFVPSLHMQCFQKDILFLEKILEILFYCIRKLRLYKDN